MYDCHLSAFSKAVLNAKDEVDSEHLMSPSPQQTLSKNLAMCYKPGNMFPTCLRVQQTKSTHHGKALNCAKVSGVGIYGGAWWTPGVLKTVCCRNVLSSFQSLFPKRSSWCVGSVLGSKCVSNFALRMFTFSLSSSPSKLMVLKILLPPSSMLTRKVAA